VKGTRVSVLAIAVLVLIVATAGPTRAESKKDSVLRSATQPLGAPSVIAVDPDYVIGKEDVLSVEVWKEPELTRVIAVRSDGKISLALIGDVQAAGLTPAQLQAKLTKLLDGYIAAPTVSVSVQDARSQRISIIGEIVRPGSYPLVKPMTVLDALAGAGGFREFAKTNKMFILRINADGKRTRIPLRYKRVITAEQANDNIELQPRDTIVVP
jgi:polysaccharide biosynthesis/export protein